jgi:hypothetical protein
MLAQFEEVKSDVSAFFAFLTTTTGMNEFADAAITPADKPALEEWFYIRCLCRLPQLLADVTEMLSGEQYPTFILAFPYLRMIREYLERINLFEDDYAEVAAEPFAKRVFDDMRARGVTRTFYPALQGFGPRHHVGPAARSSSCRHELSQAGRIRASTRSSRERDARD